MSSLEDQRLFLIGRQVLTLGASSNLISVKCRNCRRDLPIDQSQIQVHDLLESQRTPNFKVSSTARIVSSFCSSLFIEHSEWMLADYEVQCGKIACPNCKFKLGSWSWTGTSPPLLISRISLLLWPMDFSCVCLTVQ